MDFREYAQRIKFLNVRPEEPTYWSEYLNVQLPELHTKQDGVRTINLDYRLGELCAMPRMSTFAIAALINKAVREMPSDQFFVNVGVWHGFTFLSGMLGNPDKRCIGVDNFTEYGSPRAEFRKRFLEARSDKHEFFDMGYKQYFDTFHKPVDKIGFYIYDGAHDFASQLDGLTTAEPFLADNAIVMVDDTNWKDPDTATREFMAASEFNYDIILDEKTSGNGHPTWWNGILVIQKNGRKDNAAEKGKE